VICYVTIVCHIVLSIVCYIMLPVLTLSEWVGLYFKIKFKNLYKNWSSIFIICYSRQELGFTSD